MSSHLKNSLDNLEGDPAKRLGAKSSHSFAQIFPELRQAPADWRTWTPSKITVAAYPGMPITFDEKKVKTGKNPDGTDYTTWIGRPQGLAHGVALVGVACIYPDGTTGWDAVVILPNGVYNIHVKGDNATLYEEAAQKPIAGDTISPAHRAGGS